MSESSIPILSDDSFQNSGEDSYFDEHLPTASPVFERDSQFYSIVEFYSSSNLQQQPASSSQTPGSFQSYPITHLTNPNMHIPTDVITVEPKRQWSNKLGGCCCGNCSVCLNVLWCGSCYSCVLSRNLGEAGCVGCCPGGLAVLRTQYRLSHNIEGSLLDDLIKSFFCCPCVLCQLGNDMVLEGY